MSDATMASNGGHDMDMVEHELTYHRFLMLMKWSVIGLVVLLILMAWTLI